MINATNKVIKAWYELLNGNISVPVYRTDAPPDETGHYVLLRVESDSDNSNNHRNVNTVVVITEVVTKFSSRIDDSLAAEIDSEIALLLSSRPSTHNLPSQDGIGITVVVRQNATYIPEDDGTFRYLRLVTRNVHRIEQLVII